MDELDAPKITYIGHACIGIVASGGERCIVDPYESGGLHGKIGLDPIQVRADYVVTTHDHEDHAATGCLKGKPTRVKAGPAGPFEIRRWAAWHDEDGGRRFGGAVDIVTIDVDGVRILHLSDVGHSPPVDRPPEWIGADVCCIPVGGCYTIGPAQAVEWWERLRPTRTVPIHFSNDSIDLPLMSRRLFLNQCPGAVVDNLGVSSLSIADAPPRPWRIYPLEPARRE